MANKKKRDEDWERAKQLCRLNNETVCMARELGLNPRKLTDKIPTKSQPWKAPVHIWIREMYEAMKEKSAKRQAAKLAARIALGQSSGETSETQPAGIHPAQSPETTPNDARLDEDSPPVEPEVIVPF